MFSAREAVPKRLVDDLTLFDTVGPFRVPFHVGNRGSRYVRQDDGAQFFCDNETFAARKGCYVFALRSGGGITPWYVGKTTASFDGECFQYHKLAKYNEALQLAGAGTPMLFFVLYPVTRGRVSKQTVEALESYLIQSAFRRNEKLLNQTKRGEEYWGIRGVTVRTRGKPTNSARQLASMLSLE